MMFCYCNQLITLRQVVLSSDDVTHPEAKIISICPDHFIAGYFAAALQVYVSCQVFASLILFFVLHMWMA